jgi:predicted nucleic acid-binding protein
MRLLLDTNRYSDLDRGAPDVIRVVERADDVFLSFISLAELHAGFRAGTRRARNEKTLRLFLAQPNVSVLYADAATVGIWADLRAQLRAAGTPIPDHDIWIAALALQPA